MTAVGIRFRAELRARWRAWLVLAVVAGLLAGLALSAFAGARRADSALERLLAVTSPEDVSIAPGFVFQNFDVDFDRIERLPQVVGAARDRPLAALIRTRSGRQMYGGHKTSVIPLASPDGRQVTELGRVKLLDGRFPDPRRTDEILADRKALAILGLEVGETVRVRFIWKRLLGTDKVDFGADPERAAVGPLADLRIVGSMARTGSDDWSGQLRVPPRAYHAHGGATLASFQEILNVRLRRGEADIPAFRAAVDRIAGPGDFVFSPAAADRAKLQRSIHLQTRTIRMVAGIGALAVLVLLAQAFARQAAHAAGDQPTLRTLGMTRGQLVAVRLARAGVVAAVAAALAAATAIALSPLTPLGVARELEPDPGLDIDATVLAIGVPAVFAAVLAAGAFATALPAARPPRRARPALPGLPPALLAGTRLAAGTLRPTLTSTVVAVAVAAVALTFAASLDRLMTTPRLYGQNWEYEAPFDPSDVPALRAGEEIPGLPPAHWLSGAAVGTSSRLQIADRLVGVDAYDDHQGRVPPTVVDGHAPTAPDEILLARKTLDALDLQIGDRVEVRRSTRTAAMRIVGVGVVPESEWVRFGEGAALTFEGFRRVVPDAIPFRVHLRPAEGTGIARLERQYDWPGPAPPGTIADFGGIESLPALVAALLAATAAGALAHALVTSVRRRRRDLAILKTLGFVRGQVMAAVAWQATLIAVLALLVGLPLGVAVGRFLWNLFAEELGVLPEAVVPAWPLLLLVPATLLLANLVAAVPGRMAARTRPALALRAE